MSAAAAAAAAAQEIKLDWFWRHDSQITIKT
jgi:hypothetical protein